MKTTFVLFVLLLVVGVVGWRLSGSSAKPALISLDPGMTFQTITGWEATAEVGATASAAFPYYKKELFDLAVNDLGINRVRLEIKSRTENSVDYFRLGRVEERHNPVNDNADPFIINPAGFHSPN